MADHQRRGYASEALGLLRHLDAAPALRALCRDEAVPEEIWLHYQQLLLELKRRSSMVFPSIQTQLLIRSL